MTKTAAVLQQVPMELRPIVREHINRTYLLRKHNGDVAMAAAEAALEAQAIAERPQPVQEPQRIARNEAERKAQVGLWR